MMCPALSWTAQELELAVKEKDMLLSELTKLVRVYKRQVSDTAAEAVAALRAFARPAP